VNKEVIVMLQVTLSQTIVTPSYNESQRVRK